jgi:sugar phosphate isomerase/epimerase
MNKPIEAFMRVGIVHFMAFPELASGAGPWEETVRGIALDPFFDAEVRDRVKALLDLANMGLGYAAHPSILGQGLNINAVEEDVRTRACTVLKERLDEAIYMGAENFLILSGKDPGVEMRSQAVDALIGSLEELCAYSSSKQGPKVVVEAFDTEVDKCCLLGPSSMAREVAQEVSKRQSNFGLLVDLSHIPLLKESRLSWLWGQSSRLWYTGWCKRCSRGGRFPKDASKDRFSGRQ